MLTTSEPKTFLSQERVIATPEFIAAHNLRLRSTQEILARFSDHREDDFFGFGKQVLLDFLPFEDVKAFYKPADVNQVLAGTVQYEYVSTTEEAAQDLLDYLNFAWGKAEDERGISASRSLAKLGAWLWALGREDLEELISDEALYDPYGAPALIAVSEKLGIEVPASLRVFAAH